MDEESDKIDRLEDRIDQLEAVTKKMLPSRRDALKLGGAAAIGAAAMSGTASAGSNQVGTIGDANNLVDIEAEDVTINDTLNGASISGAAQDEALLSDGTGGLTFGSAGGGIPPNFTYQDVASNRSLDTVFTNNTGKALYVVETSELTFDSDLIGIRIRIDGGIIISNQRYIQPSEYQGGTAEMVAQFFVPNGSTYEIDDLFGNQEVNFWYEAQM